MEYVLIWALFGVVSAVVAANKGHPWFGWFFAGVLLGPFGLILALVKPPRGKLCPRCAELVKDEASVCRHCGTELEPVATG